MTSAAPMRQRRREPRTLSRPITLRMARSGRVEITCGRGKPARGLLREYRLETGVDADEIVVWITMLRTGR